MDQSLFASPITAFTLASVRNQARHVGEMAGLPGVQQTRFSTAVSEIARNAVEYAAGGVCTFLVNVRGADARPERLIARISDQGPGIADLPAVLAGHAHRDGRPAMGIAGSRRLVDRLAIESSGSGGIVVDLEMELPPSARRPNARELRLLAAGLADSSNPQSLLQELMQQNRELLKIHQELRDKQAELERADGLKNQFVVTLAHELRSPLSTLQMSLDILHMKPLLDPEAVGKRHAVMQRQTRQISQMVEDLLDAAQVSQGKVRLHKEPAELNGLVTHAVEMTEASIAAKNHRLTIALHDAPLWVLADASRLKQVVCNLVQNSARYTAAGGAIAIRVRCEGAHAVIEVEDNGMGISAGDLPNIFGLFVQSDRTRREAAGGLGVGLSLVRRLVEDHGGTVVAASEGADRGSRFTVSLPRVVAPQA